MNPDEYINKLYRSIDDLRLHTFDLLKKARSAQERSVVFEMIHSLSTAQRELASVALLYQSFGSTRTKIKEDSAE